MSDPGKGGIYDSNSSFAANLRRSMFSAAPSRQASAATHSAPAHSASTQSAPKPLEDTPKPRKALSAEQVFQTGGVGERIGSFLSTRDLTRLSQVSRAMQSVAERTPVEGSKARLNDVRQHYHRSAAEGFTFTGLHGASSADGPSLYAGVKMTGQEGANFDGKTQLGPGFYMTGGAGRPEQIAAKAFAENRARRSASTPEIFQVYTRNLPALRTVQENSPGLWDYKTTEPPKYLRPDHRGSDAVSGDISGYYFAQEARSARQIKINPHILADDPVAAVHPKHTEIARKNLDEITDKRKKFAIEVRPSPRPDGSLGKDFLNSIADKVRK